MRTVEVTREFYERSLELARLAKMPEVKLRLERLAEDYRLKLKELESVASESIVPNNQEQIPIEFNTPVSTA